MRGRRKRQMKLIIDHAGMDNIRRLYDYYPVCGVTTNPSILAKAKRPPMEVLKEIRSFIGTDELHAQVISKTAEEMVREAEYIRSVLGAETYVKIPVTKEGLKAIKILKKQGAFVTATCIYTHMQAYLAGQAGADYAAPYVNRMDNMGYNGIQIAKEIHDIYQKNGLKTQVLGASFKNCQQVLELLKYGVGACTVSPDVMDKFLDLAAVDAAVDDFVRDFEGLCGQGKTMLDV